MRRSVGSVTPYRSEHTRSHRAVKARILQVSSTNLTPALTKKEMRPTTEGKPASGIWPEARTASRTPMAVARA